MLVESMWPPRQHNWCSLTEYHFPAKVCGVEAPGNMLSVCFFFFLNLEIWDERFAFKFPPKTFLLPTLPSSYSQAHSRMLHNVEDTEMLAYCWGTGKGIEKNYKKISESGAGIVVH